MTLVSAPATLLLAACCYRRSVETGVPVVVEAHDGFLHPAVIDLLYGVQNSCWEPNQAPCPVPEALSGTTAGAFSTSLLRTPTISPAAAAVAAAAAAGSPELVHVAGASLWLHPSFRLLLLMHEENSQVQWPLLQKGVHVMRHCVGLEEAAEALMAVALVHEMPDLDQEQILVMRQQVRQTATDAVPIMCVVSLATANNARCLHHTCNALRGPGGRLWFNPRISCASASHYPLLPAQLQPVNACQLLVHR